MPYMQDTTALSANLKVELSAEADQRRKSEESLVRVKTELQMKTEQVLSTEQEAKCVKAELKQAEAKLLHDFKVGIHCHVTCWLVQVGS